MIKMKKLLIVLLGLILFSVSVSAQVNIVEDSLDLTGTPGQTLSPSFQIDNTGTVDLDISFTGLTLSKGSDTLNISELDNITGLLNGSSANPSFSIVIPSGQAPGVQ